MRKKINFYSIKNKLIICLLIIIILPYIFVVNYIDKQSTMYLKNEFNSMAKNDMEQFDNSISMYLKTFEDNVVFLANNKLVKNSDSEIANYLNTTEKVKMTPWQNSETEQNIYNLYSYLGDSNSSLEYVYMGMENGSFLQWPEGYINEKYDPRLRPWYKAAMENPGEITITDPYYYPAGEIEVISIVKTIMNEKNEIIGVQAIDLSLKEITDKVRNFKIGSSGYLILTDKNGTIIADPNNTEMNFKNINELNSDVFGNIGELETGISDIKIDGIEKFIYMYTSEKYGFKLISVIDKNELLGQVGNVEKDIFIMFVLFAIFAVISAWLFSTQCSKPIFIIKNHLDYMSNGDFNKNIPTNMMSRKDEFGDLSKSLELMKNRLENSINEIRKSEESVKENLNFLQVLIDTIPSPIFSKDENGVYNHCNVAYTEFLGIEKEKIINHNIYDICEKDMADIYDKADHDLMQIKGKQIYESKVMHKDGTKHDVVFNKAAIINDKGDFMGMVGVIIDITEEKAYQEKIDKLLKFKEIMLQIGYFTNETFNANELFKLILDKTIECIGIGSCGTILILEDNKLKIAVSKGYRQEGIENFSLDLENSVGWMFTNGHIDKTVIINNIEEIEEIEIIDTVGNIKIKSIISAPIIVEDKLYGFINLDSSEFNAFGEAEFELMEYIRFQLSITISKYKLYEETIYLSKFDKLTNLYNRSHFEHLVNTQVLESIKKRENFFVVLLDLDDLKLVNDKYGHLAGDKFIKTFARKLKDCSDFTDIIARFGGDEFIGVVYNRSLESVTDCIENLSKYFQDNPISLEDKKFVCSFSYGIASFPDEGDNFNSLVKIADERMYEYKRKK